MTKVFITEDIFTQGIVEVEAEIWNQKDLQFAFVKSRFSDYKIGEDAFLTFAEAKKHAKKIIKNEIAFLKRRIEKLEKMEFNAKKE